MTIPKGNIQCYGFIEAMEKRIERGEKRMASMVAGIQREIDEDRHQIALLKKEGRPRPIDVKLEFDYRYSDDYRKVCDYDGSVIYPSHHGKRPQFVYTGIISHDPFDTLDLCPSCAYKWAPYLTCALVPFLKRNLSLYLALQKRFPQELFDLRESRVPRTMSFIRRVCDMKLFL